MLTRFVVPDFHGYEEILRYAIKNRHGSAVKEFYVGVIVENYQFLPDLFNWIFDLHEFDRKRIGLYVHEKPGNISDIRCNECDGSHYRLMYRRLMIEEKQYYYHAITGYSMFVDVPELFS